VPLIHNPPTADHRDAAAVRRRQPMRDDQTQTLQASDLIGILCKQSIGFHFFVTVLR
jgi:hypothetical protein